MADDQRRLMQGKVFPIRGRRRPRPGARLPAQRPPPTSCLAEYASVTASRTPGVTDQDLCQSEAWLGKCRHLAGVIGAVIAGLPPKAHHRGRGRGEHLSRPWRGAGGRVVGWMMGRE